MLTKKKIALISGLFVLFLVVIGCSSNTQGDDTTTGESDTTTQESNTTNQDGDTITLRLASYSAPNVLFVKEGLEPFMDRVTELTDGKVEFEFFPGEQLGNASDHLKLTGDGVVELGHVLPTFTPSEMPLSSTLIAIPGLFDDSTNASKALLEVAKQSPMLDTDFQKNGVRPILSFVSPPQEIFTDGKEIKVPEDLKGLKVRASGGALMEVLQLFDSSPVQITSMDVYNAFSSKVVNAVSTYAVGQHDYAWDELTKYATKDLGLGSHPLFLTINEMVYQDLPEDVQKAIMQAGEEMSVRVSEAHNNETEGIYENWIKDGITVYELTEQDKKQWKNVYEEIEDQFIENYDNEELSQVVEAFKSELE